MEGLPIVEASLLYEALQKLGSDVLVLESVAGYLRSATEIAVPEKLNHIPMPFTSRKRSSMGIS